jgi:ADP-heptose:LPS heptosyltransferase
VPTLRALRATLPEAHLTLISLRNAGSFVARFPHYLNDWLEFPGYPGIPEVPVSSPRIVSFLANAQLHNFDLALQMHGNGTYINCFTMLLGARLNAGFFPAQMYCPDRDRFLPYPEHEPEIWRLLRLMEFLGVPLQGDFLEFPILQSDWEEFKAIALVHNLRRGNYICIHPGASVPERCWSYRYFAAVADTLAAQGYQVVLTGTSSEWTLTETIVQTMQFPAINLAGQTSLGAIAALLKHSRLLICNDTGVSHLAAALEVPSVVIFTHSDPRRWAPLNRQRHRIVVNLITEPEARSLRQGKFSAPLSQPTPAQVLAEVTTLLQQEVAYVS